MEVIEIVFNATTWCYNLSTQHFGRSELFKLPILEVIASLYDDLVPILTNEQPQLLYEVLQIASQLLQECLVMISGQKVRVEKLKQIDLVEKVLEYYINSKDLRLFTVGLETLARLIDASPT